MYLKELLQELGVSTKELRQRFANKQIKINGALCTALDHHLNISDGYWESGEFIDSLLRYNKDTYDYESLKYLVNHVSECFGESNVNTPMRNFLSDFTCISISKKEHFVFMNL